MNFLLPPMLFCSCNGEPADKQDEYAFSPIGAQSPLAAVDNSWDGDAQSNDEDDEYEDSSTSTQDPCGSPLSDYTVQVARKRDLEDEKQAMDFMAAVKVRIVGSKWLRLTREAKRRKAVPTDSAARQAGGDGDKENRPMPTLLESKPVFVERSAWRRPSVVKEWSEISLPDTTMMSKKAIVSTLLENVTVAKVRALIEEEGQEAPLVKFQKHVLHCDVYCLTPWMNCSSTTDVKARRSRYVAPVSIEVPCAVKKTLGLPDAVKGTTFSCVGPVEGDLVLTQRTRLEGLAYGDRYRLVSTHVFSQRPEGVQWNIWCEAICVKSVPWTHSFLHAFAEKIAKTEAQQQLPELVRLMRKRLYPENMDQ
eukprot:TRINITY_DN123077_c0_g1_i1.p1 TRINITY_DN123077_c0_g1~~TRINITY_DN123077_c0_g1_i1.p1  ORF type:complete len:390 (-),score=63.04 TRINITY_DN123077_c0_g1_i1:371-1462(-)